MTRTFCRVRTILLVSVLLLSGCALGGHYRYDDVRLGLTAKGSTTLAVAVHDQRPYILSGDKEPDFVGLIRGGYGNPFDVTTVSGKPLAEEMTSALAASLRDVGFTITSVSAPYTTNAPSVISQLQGTGAAKSACLTLREWKSDTMIHVGLIYNVVLEVRDQHGTVIAYETLQGRDNLEGASGTRPALPGMLYRKVLRL